MGSLVLCVLDKPHYCILRHGFQGTILSGVELKPSLSLLVLGVIALTSLVAINYLIQLMSKVQQCG